MVCEFLANFLTEPLAALLEVEAGASTSTGDFFLGMGQDEGPRVRRLGRVFLTGMKKLNDRFANDATGDS